ncbi:FAD-dependent monooxygenase [Kribbella kalugense]|uniref:2-polyprenyl-6-methoxyphenol hydroxylase-like FAD-dependent oxidoreductase n=1 Tax=Kribbella kalugense TaxID=2512221 RepID=A0A4V3G789_9ACTN|nr:FAD-dependent monooxygenase [Kribbella kalugense]TDW17954.1 2-polyprenyl-6-methoxyphenol hydroxylase-like FAD-dependent oxidoreductase [Kribbella kalugense]
MTTVLISGASVAGPALAYWLQRYGYSPTVVERAPAPRPGGYAVDFRGASMTVLERMGILDAVRAKATNMGDITYVNEQGKRVASTPPSALSGELEILRGDLVEILYSRTADTTEYLFGDSIASLTDDGSGVDVVFESGLTRRFDLVIGADGQHSNVRRLAFGPESSYAHDLGYYVSVSTVANHLGLDHTGQILNVPGKTVGTYSARHNAEAKALFYFTAKDKLDYDRRDPESQKAIIDEQFAGIGWEVPTLLAGMRQAPDFYFDSITQIKLDSYSRGRVALVGDAGYCASSLSGMGTSLAIVGAYVLAGELHAAGGDHVRAFAEYDVRMKDFVAACQKLALEGAMWFIPGSKGFMKLRNLTLRMMPYLPWRKVIEQAPLKAGNAIELRTYEDQLPRPAVPRP